jgi:hypothetical protein
MKMQAWQAALIDSLEDLSDTERQKSAWLDLTGAFFPAPVELICQVFDDSAIDISLAKGRVFSDETDAILRWLMARVADFDVAVDPRVLLSSAAWTEIAHEAARAALLIRRDLAGAEVDQSIG